jgi:hypothetical protein
MEVNNYAQIRELLQFRTTDDFYFLQILKRRKENKTLSRNSVTIRNYYIYSIEQFDRIFPEVVALSTVSRARACINLNRKSFIDVGHDTAILIAKYIKEGKFNKIFSAYDKAIGASNNEKSKNWIVDIDTHDEKFGSVLREIINNLPPFDVKEKIKGIIPTKNGYHLITSGFDVKKFGEGVNWDSFTEPGWVKPDIQKNNPTILYIPDLQDEE